MDCRFLGLYIHRQEKTRNNQQPFLFTSPTSRSITQNVCHGTLAFRTQGRMLPSCHLHPRTRAGVAHDARAIPSRGYRSLATMSCLARSSIVARSTCGGGASERFQFFQVEVGRESFAGGTESAAGGTSDVHGGAPGASSLGSIADMVMWRYRGQLVE